MFRIRREENLILVDEMRFSTRLGGLTWHTLIGLRPSDLTEDLRKVADLSDEEILRLVVNKYKGR